MKLFILLFLSAFIVVQITNAQTKAKTITGENFLVLNGERFHEENIQLTPDNSGLSNLWFDNGNMKYTDLKFFGRYKDRNVQFQIHVNGQKGVYKIENNRESTGSQRDDLNCYLLMDDKDTPGDGLNVKTGSVTINFTRYDVPGGLIEGAINGQLFTGARNDIPIFISGKFSVVRTKDHKSF